MGRVRVFFALVVLLLLMFISTASFAEEPEIREMKRQIEVLTEEMEKLKLGAVAEPKYESFMGLGPAASKVYGVEKGLSIGGYGEVFYNNYQHPSKKDLAEAHRFILYAGYKFNEWIILNSELEYEAEGGKGAFMPEFAYLDFLFGKSFNLRAGNILMPIGLINEFHEPTVFNGVLRPDIETNIIPTTWHVGGAMAFGDIGDLKYKFALTEGLRADFKASNWIAEGMQHATASNTDVSAYVGNISYQITPSLLIGGAYYRGDAEEGKGDEENKSADKKGTVSLWEIHAQYQSKGIQLKGLYTRGSLDANDAIKSDPSMQKVGKEAEGWYLETAYDIMPFVKQGSEMSLTPFVRYEAYDTNKDVFNGQSRDATLDRRVLTYGIGFKPHPNVVIKADYQYRDTASSLSEGKGANLDENKIDQFNLGIGFIF